MAVPSDLSRAKWPHSKRFLLLIGILILVPGSCCVSYLFEPLNIFYFSVAGRHYYELALTKVPEFDQLNDELVAEIPIYPGSVLIPGTERRGGPGAGTMPVAPGGPRVLEVCYEVDVPISNVVDFYKHRLKEDGWNLVRVRTWPITRWIVFSKDKACVEIANRCASAGKELQNHSTAYLVKVYYDLNVLLGFPGVPDGGCP